MSWRLEYKALREACFEGLVKAVSNDLGIPDHRMLLAVMEFESGLDPAARNKNTGATGLIQFMPATAIALGTNVDVLRAMTGVEQMRYVIAYLKPFKGRLKTLGDLYMAMLWPRGVGQGDHWVLWLKGSNAYRVNPLDLNEDGEITKGEASARVERIYRRMLDEDEIDSGTRMATARVTTEKDA
jgi:hypothetical protein